jgi:hypothetical protein
MPEIKSSYLIIKFLLSKYAVSRLAESLGVTIRRGMKDDSKPVADNHHF